MNAATRSQPATGGAAIIDITDPDVFRNLRAVSLDELNTRAALQTRVDRKYLVERVDLPALLGLARDAIRVLEVHGHRRCGYRSTYFDTPLSDSYLGAVRSRPDRFKVRARTYLDSDAHYLEVKTRNRAGHTTKTRRLAEAAIHDALCRTSRQFVIDTLTEKVRVGSGGDHRAKVAALRPTLSTCYQRTTLLVEHESSAASRATIDTGLVFAAPGQRRRMFPDLAIVETKSAGVPSAIDRLLWRSGHRPVKISKFGVGLALFDPELPTNKWNRVLRSHFSWRRTLEAA